MMRLLYDRQRRLLAMAAALAAAAAGSIANAAPPAEFGVCAACHSVTKNGPNGIGPNLYGVYGAKAGTSPASFNYSPALKNAKIVWTSDALDKWLTSPSKFVNGSRMPFAGIADANKRAAIIAYLKTLK